MLQESLQVCSIPEAATVHLINFSNSREIRCQSQREEGGLVRVVMVVMEACVFVCPRERCMH